MNGGARMYHGTNLDPVSYTHLDVYKRQDAAGAAAAGAAAAGAAESDATAANASALVTRPSLPEPATAVSYTHLDVYKRQRCV